MSYYFYILRCADDSLYCGQTNNLHKRLEEHNFDKNKAAKYLRGRKPVKLIYSEKYITRQQAMKREYEVKQLSKAKKEAIVQMPKLSFH